MADIPGYAKPSVDQVALVTQFKETEERLLREIDAMRDSDADLGDHRFDQRWLSVAQTQLQQAFMSLNRAVFRPSRIRLPGDDKPE